MEAVVEEPPPETPPSANKGGGRRSRSGSENFADRDGRASGGRKGGVEKRGGGGRGGGGGKGRGGRGRAGGPVRDGLFVPPQTEDIVQYTVQQIESLFSTDNLCQDTYLRSFMDEEGFVPLGILYCYQNVVYFCADPAEVLNKISSKGSSYFLETDKDTATVRLRSGWEKWLMPNEAGGLGVPKYTVEGLASYEYGGYDYDASSHGEESYGYEHEAVGTPGGTTDEPLRPRLNSGGELSATASVFTPTNWQPPSAT